jgi:hypothetical protein
MLCGGGSLVVSAAHVELFAADRVVIVPAGIGVDPPLRVRGAFVRGGQCEYPLRTLDPTGLVLFGRGARHTLGALFAVWGQPLSPTAMAGFHTSPRHRVSVFIGGALWHGDPAAAPLTPGSQVTIEVGVHVPPHAGYTFPSLAWVRS